MLPEIREKLDTYHRLLLQWQAKINLISPNTIDTAWTRHFEDSLQILPLLPKGPCTLFDLGCGAGFPGLVLAMSRPDIAVTLIESDTKKCAFMKTVSRETHTPATVLNERIESVSRETVATPDVITARALASLDKLFTYCAPWIADNPDITLIFPKGEGAAQEIETVQKNWTFTQTIHPSHTDPAAALLVLRQIQKHA